MAPGASIPRSERLGIAIVLGRCYLGQNQSERVRRYPAIPVRSGHAFRPIAIPSPWRRRARSTSSTGNRRRPNRCCRCLRRAGCSARRCSENRSVRLERQLRRRVLVRRVLERLDDVVGLRVERDRVGEAVGASSADGPQGPRARDQRTRPHEYSVRGRLSTAPRPGGDSRRTPWRGPGTTFSAGE